MFRVNPRVSPSKNPNGLSVLWLSNRPNSYLLHWRPIPIILASRLVWRFPIPCRLPVCACTIATSCASCVLYRTLSASLRRSTLLLTYHIDRPSSSLFSPCPKREARYLFGRVPRGRIGQQSVRPGRYPHPSRTMMVHPSQEVLGAGRPPLLTVCRLPVNGHLHRQEGRPAISSRGATLLGSIIYPRISMPRSLPSPLCLTSTCRNMTSQ